jgi:hypothetical protein
MNYCKEQSQSCVSSKHHGIDFASFLCGVVNGEDAPLIKNDKNDDKYKVNQVYNQLVSKNSARMFRKSDYCDILKQKREEFILSNFASEIENISKTLEQDAKNFKDCNHTCYFNIPELYSLEKVEMMLQEYFRDCGYLVVLSRGDKDSPRNIKIVLS